MNDITKLTFYTIAFLFIFTFNSLAEEKPHYVFEDRNIKKAEIISINYKDENLSKTLSDLFINLLTSNKSGVQFFSTTSHADVIIELKIKNLVSEVKNINISDFVDYIIKEQQVKFEVELIVTNTKDNELIWKRKYSKYDSQAWLVFSKPRIGSNNIISTFNSPDNISVSMYQKYKEYEFIERVFVEVLTTLCGNLVKI